MSKASERWFRFSSPIAAMATRNSAILKLRYAMRRAVVLHLTKVLIGEMNVRNDVKKAPYNVLFLCTGNSARSIMAEVILNRAGQEKFRAFSAGSQPKGQVHPYALDLLRRLHFDVAGLRSKSWKEFSGPDAPKLDFVFTVCDNAAKEPCPVWPGQPMTAHWGIPDPAEATGTEAEVRFAFADALRMLTNRINIFVSLPLRSLDQLTLQKQLDAIGKSKDAGAPPASVA
jgi:protein-tyrosine-phosphatase